MSVIGLYGEVGWEITLPGVQESLNACKQGEQVTLELTSIGGSIAEGLSIYNLLKRYNVDVVINGYAYSIATVIACAGKRVRMYRNSVLLVHPASCACGGNAKEHSQIAEQLENHGRMIRSIYAEKTGLSDAELESLMDGPDGNGTWLMADDAVKYGFVDEVIEAEPAAARYGRIKRKEASMDADSKKQLPVAMSNQGECGTPPGKKTEDNDGALNNECGNPAKEDEQAQNAGEEEEAPATVPEESDPTEEETEQKNEEDGERVMLRIDEVDRKVDELMRLVKALDVLLRGGEGAQNCGSKSGGATSRKLADMFAAKHVIIADPDAGLSVNALINKLGYAAAKAKYPEKFN